MNSNTDHLRETMPVRSTLRDEAVATVTHEGAQAEFEAMLRGLGGIKAGATRPSGGRARRPNAGDDHDLVQT